MQPPLPGRVKNRVDRPRTPHRRGKIAAIILVGALLVVLVAALPRMIGKVVRGQLDAEIRLHAVLVTAHAVRAFADTQSPPRWPTSWDELSSVEHDGGWIAWPRDRTLIEKHVALDFNADLQAVLAGPAKSLTAIRPDGDCFEGWQHDAWHVLRDAHPTAP